MNEQKPEINEQTNPHRYVSLKHKDILIIKKLLTMWITWRLGEVLCL